MEAVQEDSYYLSCDELLVIAEGARQNIVVCKRAAGESSFQIEGYVLENVNETVVVYVQSNNTTRVRSHFERLALTIVSADSGPSGSEGARGSSAEGDAELGASGFSVDNSGASERGENKVPTSASEACANEMGLRGLEQGAVEETHEATKERRWKKQQEISTHFEKQRKEILRAPGLGFVEGILWQMGVVEDAFVWEVALNVLHHIATTPKSWRRLFPESNPSNVQCQRRNQFRKHGVAKLLETARADAEYYDVLFFVLDHCRGVRDRVWAAVRLRCGQVFVQGFVDWSNTCVHVREPQLKGEPEFWEPGGTQIETPSFTLQLLCIDGVYLELRSQRYVTSEDVHAVRESILGRLGFLRCDPYWSLSRLDVWPTAHDLMFVKGGAEDRTTQSDSGDS